MAREASHVGAIATRAWYTLKEACDLKGVPYSTVRHNPALLPWGSQIVGGRLRYPRAVVVEWAAMTDDACADKHVQLRKARV